MFSKRKDVVLLVSWEGLSACLYKELRSSLKCPARSHSAISIREFSKLPETSFSFLDCGWVCGRRRILHPGTLNACEWSFGNQANNCCFQKRRNREKIVLKNINDGFILILFLKLVFLLTKILKVIRFSLNWKIL